MKPVWVSGLAATFLALGGVVAPAQEMTFLSVISHIEGTVYLDGQRVESSATSFSVKEGSFVRTETGRAEILLAPGVTLRLGENSSFRMIDNRRSDTRIEVLTGSAVVLTDDNARDTNPFRRVLAPKVTVVCENVVTLSNLGVYRFNARRVVLPTHQDYNYCQFRVSKGAATVQLLTVSAVVISGETMALNRACGDHIPVNKFDIGDTDGLDRWSKDGLSDRPTAPESPSSDSPPGRTDVQTSAGPLRAGPGP